MSKSKQLTDEEILAEIKRLSEQAQLNSSHQLDLLAGVDLGDEDVDNNFSDSVLQGTADPDRAHRLYYTMRRMMIDNLPKGRKNLKLRRYVYDEKSIFLNRGKDKDENGIRGSDERMTYIDNFLQVGFNIVVNWVKEGANPFDLYMAFWNLNEGKGYHKEKAPETTFDRILKATLEVPPPKKDK